MISRLLISSFACFLLLGCAPFQGTGTGNPVHSELGAPTGSITTFAETLIGATCDVLKRCQGVVPSECATALLPMTTFSPKIGLTKSFTLNEIMTLEQNGVLQAKPAAANLCLIALNSKDCLHTSPNYGDAPAMLDDACVGVFAGH